MQASSPSHIEMGLFCAQENAMTIFKSIHDLKQLITKHPAYLIVKTYLHRTGHLEGDIVLIEQGDTDINLPELKDSLAEIQWEGVTIQDAISTAPI